MKKFLMTTAALALMCGSAFAQSSTGPAPQGDNMNKPGMTNGSMDKGAMHSGTTTGSAMKPDASQQGAPTGAAVNSTGNSTEPGKVKDGASR